MLVGTCTCQPKIGDVDYMFKETGRAGNFMMGRYFAGLLAVQVQLKGEATKFAANLSIGHGTTAIDDAMLGRTSVGVLVSGMLGMG